MEINARGNVRPFISLGSTTFCILEGSTHRNPTGLARLSSRDTVIRPECLDEDVLAAVMDLAHATLGLRSLKRASTSSQERVILVSKALEMGSVLLRDAIVLAQTEPLDWYSDDYYDKVTDVVKEYGRRLDSHEPQTWGANHRTFKRAIELHEATEFFVGLYAATRLSALQETDPASATPLSKDERVRLSLAFTRLQILTRLHPRHIAPRSLCHDTKELVFAKFFSLFHPWELEQISEANEFAFTACRALMICEADDPLGPRGGYTRQEYFHKFYWNLEAFRRKILAASAKDGSSLVESIRACLSEERSRAIGGTPVRHLDGSHRYWSQPTTPHSADEVISAVRGYVDKTTIEHAPYGWRDATVASYWSAWGLDLLDDGPEVPEEVEWWRWMGFVFWDQDRVEAVKQAATIKGYQTGWLNQLLASQLQESHQRASQLRASESEGGDN